jgi:hypothetical protein
MAKILKDTGADTIMLIPPTHRAKMDITTELIEAAKQAGVQNVCLLSSAGADLADPQKQPRLREFVDIEQIVMASKGEESTPTGHSPVVVRAGFYAENLLNYYKQAQEDGTLPLPIGKNHKFAPVALGVSPFSLFSPAVEDYRARLVKRCEAMRRWLMRDADDRISHCYVPTCSAATASTASTTRTGANSSPSRAP